MLLFVAAIWAGQRKLIYFPSAFVPDPETVGLRSAVRVAFPTSDGLTLNGWFVSPDTNPKFSVIVFNGNAGNRAYRAPLAHALVRAGMSVLIFDYRGYGGNPGSPTEDGLKVDARAAHSYVLSRAGVDPSRVVYFGESLGTGLATDLALEFPPAGLILRSPFPSLTAVGQHHYPWLPVRWMLRDRYDTLERIQHLRAPLLVIAGDLDSIVPISLSRQLFEAAPEPKRWLSLPGADHNDAVLSAGPPLIEGVLRFLADLR